MTVLLERKAQAPAGRAAGGTPARLLSLDALRGMTVLAMLVVENQGSGAHAFPGMRHAAWHGLTPADVVFPCFLFLVGTSMAFSLARHEGAGLDRALARRVAVRSAKLFGLGLLLTGLGRVPLDTLHVMGVLQRIALCYLLAAVVVVHMPLRRQVALAAGILLAYWALLAAFPVPGHGAGVLTPEGNAVGFVDRALLGQERLYGGGPYDPEGLAGTPAALVTVLCGYWAGRWIRGGAPDGRVAGALALAGAAATATGALWSLSHPLNKRLWTGSFTLLTAGLALLLLAAVYAAVEVRGSRRAAAAFVPFGVNAVLVYVLSELVGGVAAGTGAKDWLYRHLFVPWAGVRGGALTYALAYAGLWWVLARSLQRRGIAVKV